MIGIVNVIVIDIVDLLLEVQEGVKSVQEEVGIGVKDTQVMIVDILQIICPIKRDTKWTIEGIQLGFLI